MIIAAESKPAATIGNSTDISRLLSDTAIRDMQPDESVTAAAIDVLNRAFAADPAAIHSMLCVRIPCNRALADDPTVVVEPGHVGYTLDVMGLINGLLSELGQPLISTYTDDEPDLDGTHRLLGFRRYRYYTYSPER